ncbi:MAG: UDP-N-acetylmuramate--L-alanine ligase [Bryobacteraceae bacterium]|nr:UDP-N-acetylmuramate--L-alanine ligase [Bryobacteraceae bacterium]
MFFKPQQLHFTGIGGIGMSGIAEILLNLGYQITGSDLKLSPVTERLTSLGARIYEGHAASNIAGAKALVISSAVDDSNPEVQEARQIGIPVIPRGELLAELMRLKFGIAIAGSHGKTTTTSMVATILNHGGLDPTVVVGGRVSTMGGSNARLGSSQFLVVESDESDGSFLKLSPILAVVTNIDREHLDHYTGGIEEIETAFADFVNKVPFYGAAILCLDDEHVQRILPRVRRRVITYGLGTQSMLAITGVACGHLASDFQLRFKSEELGSFRINVPGVHNILNASAAVAVAMELGLETARIREGLAEYQGVDRRFQQRGSVNGITVVDDYGHHPTEVRATLAAARECRFGRILVVFQPHRYTRTMHLMDEFARAFHNADVVFVLDIYAASEDPIPGVDAQTLADRMRAFGHRGAEYAGTIDLAVAGVIAQAREGDLVLTLGAGNVWQAGDRILAQLRETQLQETVS